MIGRMILGIGSHSFQQPETIYEKCNLDQQHLCNSDIYLRKKWDLINESTIYLKVNVNAIKSIRIIHLMIGEEYRIFQYYASLTAMAKTSLSTKKFSNKTFKETHSYVTKYYEYPKGAVA